MGRPSRRERGEAPTRWGARRLACRVAIAASSVLFVASWTARSAAQEASDAPEESSDALARRYFDLGRVAFAEGRYEEALAAFQRSHELSGRSALLYNIALTYDRMRDDVHALEAYEAYLASNPDAVRVHGELEERVARLREAIARREAEDPPAPPEGDATSPATPRTPSEGGPGAGPWIVLGVGAAVALGGGVLLGLAEADRTTVEGVSEPTPFDAVRDAAERYEPLLYSGIAGLAVGAAAVAGGVLWLVLAPDGRPDAATVSLGPRGIAITGAF